MINLRIGDIVKAPSGSVGEINKFLEGGGVVVHYFDGMGIACYEYIEQNRVVPIIKDEDMIAFARFGNTTIANIIDDVPYDYAECAKALFFINIHSIDADVEEGASMALYHANMIIGFINNGDIDQAKLKVNKEAIAEYTRVAMAINSPLEMAKAMCITTLFYDAFKLPKLIEILKENFNEKA